ncbi:MAG: tyrosine-type recombinase/integrase [Nitrospiraceae bacterium]|jgi:integrase|nr:tyrosine-type recombinase/integrase [Nitrospiraceae bacterium]
MREISRTVAKKVKLTRENIERIPLATKRETYWDTELPGFCLRVSGKKKMFSVVRRMGEKVVWVKLQEYSPAYTPERARKDAINVLSEINNGINPNEREREDRALSVTLKEALAKYLEVRSLKPRTKWDMETVLDRYLNDWKDIPLVELTKTMIEKKHREIGKLSHAQANLTFRYLRAIYNFAMAHYEKRNGSPILTDNPVKKLSQTRAWFRVGRRTTIISAEQLPAWYQALQEIRGEGMTPKDRLAMDYLLVCLFTGLRKNEAAGLKWADVNFKAKTLTVKDTKNGEDHTLPLSDFLLSLFKERKQGADSLFVFPGTGKGGFLVEPRRQVEKVEQRSGVQFCLHDLRRVFASVAASVVSAYELKRLMNHKNGSDVTLGYVVPGVDGLRAPMQRITDRILELANANSAKTANEEGGR